MPLILILLAAACSSLPLAVRDMQVMDISYNQANQNTESYENVPVRWGGVIVDVENEEDYSLMQVLF